MEGLNPAFLNQVVELYKSCPYAKVHLENNQAAICTQNQLEDSAMTCNSNLYESEVSQHLLLAFWHQTDRHPAALNKEVTYFYEVNTLIFPAAIEFPTAFLIEKIGEIVFSYFDSTHREVFEEIINDAKSGNLSLENYTTKRLSHEYTAMQELNKVDRLCQPFWNIDRGKNLLPASFQEWNTCQENRGKKDQLKRDWSMNYAEPYSLIHPKY